MEKVSFPKKKKRKLLLNLSTLLYINKYCITVFDLSDKTAVYCDCPLQKQKILIEFYKTHIKPVITRYYKKELSGVTGILTGHQGQLLCTRQDVPITAYAGDAVKMMIRWGIFFAKTKRLLISDPNSQGTALYQALITSWKIKK